MPDQVKFTNQLKGLKVLVIGGSSGIGYGVAEALTENGCEVIISSSNQAKVDAKVEQLKESYPSASSRVSGFPCDLGGDDIEENIVKLLEHSGKLDHIVWTAGDRLAVMPPKDYTLSNIRAAGQVRFVGPLLLAKHAPKYLSGGPKSSITLTTGGCADRPNPNWAVVNAYLSGLHGITRGLALDLAPIRVNLVSPGAVTTELWDSFGLDKATIGKMMEGLKATLPTGHIGTTEELAESYLYLIKDTNCTGSIISTDSGALLKGPAI